MLKSTVYDLVRSTACLVLIGSLWKLQITWTGIKSQRSSNSSRIGLKSLWSYLPLSAKKNSTSDFVRSIACVIFIQSLWNLQINRTGIKHLTGWKLGHIALFTLPLIAGMLGLRWAIFAPVGNFFHVECLESLSKLIKLTPNPQSKNRDSAIVEHICFWLFLYTFFISLKGICI